MPAFPNLAMRTDMLTNPDAEYTARLEALDATIKAELEAAGLEAKCVGELFRKANGEVPTKYRGFFPEGSLAWSFRRNWYYWVCEGPGIPADAALDLHRTHGKYVRVDGHCGCPDPVEWFKGLGVGHYHVDTSEGLAALVSTIRAVAARYADHQPIPGGKT